MHLDILSRTVGARSHRNLVPRMTGMMEDRWLSVDEIAEHVGVVKASVYRWIEHRGLPAHRVGKLWKFKKDEVDEWVRSGGAANEGRAAPESRPRKRR